MNSLRKLDESKLNISSNFDWLSQVIKGKNLKIKFFIFV